MHEGIVQREDSESEQRESRHDEMKDREQPQLLYTVPPMMERQSRQLVTLIDRLIDVFEEAPSGAGNRAAEKDDDVDGC